MAALKVERSSLLLLTVRHIGGPSIICPVSVSARLHIFLFIVLVSLLLYRLQDSAPELTPASPEPQSESQYRKYPPQTQSAERMIRIYSFHELEVEGISVTGQCVCY